MGPLCERDLDEVALLAREAVSVSAAGAIEMKPEGKAAFMSCVVGGGVSEVSCWGWRWVGYFLRLRHSLWVVVLLLLLSSIWLGLAIGDLRLG
jgi:hypothetical protein